MPTSAKRDRPAWGDFLSLAENRSALRAARALAQALAQPTARVPFSPLILHGSPGTGKSHLVRALLDHLTQGTITVQSIAAADLARASAAVETGPEAEPTFMDPGLQACDLFVLEDLHQLPAKAADAVCDLLDRRSVDRRKATVITMNAGPAVLVHLPRRLTSRLTAGLVVQLAPLSPASRKKLLRSAASARNLRLTPDAIEWLAGLATGGGIRPLLGTLAVLVPLGRGDPRPLDRARVEELLAGAGQPASEGATPASIVKRVAAAFGVTEKELLGPSRLRRALRPRQVAMYLTRELTKLSLPRIGAFFDGRDHTTVLHAHRKVTADIEADETFGGRVKQLKAELS